jgi:hypothetical protein
MALIEIVSMCTFVKDVEHTPLHPKKQYNSLLPTALASSAAPSSSDEPRSSSSGRWAFFKLLKGLFFIYQSNKHEMDVFHKCQEVQLENHQNLHQKMQVEQPFVEFCPIEANPHFLVSFASLTAAEMVYLGIDAPDTSSSHARCKHASTTISNSDKEGDDGNNDTKDYKERRTMSSSCYYSFLFPFWCLGAKGGEVAILFPFRLFELVDCEQY